MPITREQWHAYPEDWETLAFTVKTRAGWRCECTGQCGRTWEHLDPTDGRCRNRHMQPRWRATGKQRLVVLSCAHLDHDPSVDDPSRLAAFCQGCHLAYDAAQHWTTRRRRWEEQAGLLALF